jgi:hypothetical protein
VDFHVLSRVSDALGAFPRRQEVHEVGNPALGAREPLRAFPQLGITPACDLSQPLGDLFAGVGDALRGCQPALNLWEENRIPGGFLQMMTKKLKLSMAPLLLGLLEPVEG